MFGYLKCAGRTDERKKGREESNITVIECKMTDT